MRTAATPVPGILADEHGFHRDGYRNVPQTRGLRTRAHEGRQSAQRCFRGITDPLRFGDVRRTGAQSRRAVPDVHRATGRREVPSRGCPRSRQIQDAEEDLKYFAGLKEALPTGTVFGRVLVDAGSPSADNQAPSGANVELRGPAGAYSSYDRHRWSLLFHAGRARRLQSICISGRLSDGVRRRLSDPWGSRRLFASWPFISCCGRSTKGSIEGRLIRADGMPGPSGAPVTLIAVDTREGGEVSAGLAGFGETDDEGRYSSPVGGSGPLSDCIEPISCPDPGQPVPDHLLAGLSGRVRQAFAVQVTDAPFERRYDFRLTPEPAFAVISGTALFADGRPAAGVRIQIDVPPDNLITEEEDEPVTDASGNISLLPLWKDMNTGSRRLPTVCQSSTRRKRVSLLRRDTDS